MYDLLPPSADIINHSNKPNNKNEESNKSLKCRVEMSSSYVV